MDGAYAAALIRKDPQAMQSAIAAARILLKATVGRAGHGSENALTQLRVRCGKLHASINSSTLERNSLRMSDVVALLYPITRSTVGASPLIGRLATEEGR